MISNNKNSNIEEIIPTNEVEVQNDVEMQENVDNLFANTHDMARRSRRKSIIGKVVIYAILVLYAMFIIFPFSIVIITSIKTWIESRSPIFTIFPKDGYTLEGYKEVLKYDIFGTLDLPIMIQGFLNTLVYVIPPTFMGLFVSTLSAYAFAKLRFKASKFMYAVLLATMMIPGTITIAPQYLVYDTLRLTRTFPAFPLIIPGMFGAAACVFFMRQFISGIPDSVVEAAKIDGVGYFGIFIKIIIPLSVPALIAQGLLGFIGGYNDYFGPLIYLKDNSKFNLQLALQLLEGAYNKQRPSYVMAATVVALAPTLIIYFIAQEFFIEGIAASGIKG